MSNSKSFFNFNPPRFLKRIPLFFESVFRKVWNFFRPSTASGTPSETQNPSNIVSQSGSEPEITSTSTKPTEVTAQIPYEVESSRPIVDREPSASELESTTPDEGVFEDVDEQGMSLLMRAVQGNVVSEVEKILNTPNLQVNINYANPKENNITALGLAVANANPEMVKLLLKHNPDIMLETSKPGMSGFRRWETDSVLDFDGYWDWNRNTALYASSPIDRDVFYTTPEYQSNYLKIFELISNKTLLFMLHDNNLFMNILSLEDASTIDKLFSELRKKQKNANFFFNSFYSRPLLDSVAFPSLLHPPSEEDSYTFQVGFNYVSISAPITRIQSPIGYALRMNATNVALSLLKNALSIEAFSDLKLPEEEKRINLILNEALVCACTYNNEEVINFCLENGNIKQYSQHYHDRSGFSALTIAAFNGHFSNVKKLVEHGLDVNFILPKSRIGSNITALYFAFLSKNNPDKESIIYYLINNGAKLNSDILERMKAENFTLDFSKINVLVEFFDQNDPKLEAYEDIVEAVYSHNHAQIDPILKKITPVVTSEIISNYLYPKKPIKNPIPSEEDENKPERPPTPKNR